VTSGTSCLPGRLVAWARQGRRVASHRSIHFLHNSITLPFNAGMYRSINCRRQWGPDTVAGDLLGLYIGGAIGQSRVVETAETACACDLDPGTILTERFDKTHLAFQVALGARPISLLGAEIDYIDFGKPGGVAYTFPESASIKGVAAFGLLYLPVPVVDIYLKAGAARLESTLGFSYCGPCACDSCLNSVQLERTNTSGAGGVGAQYRFGSWAVRVEYERFNAAGAKPSLLSAGITWISL
jgi:hypothetical protein